MNAHLKLALAMSMVATFFPPLLPTSASADAILEYNTVNEFGPHELELGIPTPIEITVRDTTGEQWGIGGVVFDFQAPDGGLSWDLDGPDDEPFTRDDGFRWESGLDRPPYHATVDPPQTAGSNHGGVQVPSLGTVLLATLTVTGNDIGEFLLISGDPLGLIWNNEDFGEMVIENGTEQAVFNVVPEPTTLGMLTTAGVFVFLLGQRCTRRRRQ